MLHIYLLIAPDAIIAEPCDIYSRSVAPSSKMLLNWKSLSKIVSDIVVECLLFRTSPAGLLDQARLQASVPLRSSTMTPANCHLLMTVCFLMAMEQKYGSSRQVLIMQTRNRAQANGSERKWSLFVLRLPDDVDRSLNCARQGSINYEHSLYA